MAMLSRRRVGTLMIAFSVIMFTMLLFSYPDPQRFFFVSFPPDLCACPGPCVADLQDDPLFSKRFNISFYPLMTKDNNALSKDTFNWWQVRPWYL